MEKPLEIKPLKKKLKRRKGKRAIKQEQIELRKKLEKQAELEKARRQAEKEKLEEIAKKEQQRLQNILLKQQTKINQKLIDYQVENRDDKDFKKKSIAMVDDLKKIRDLREKLLPDLFKKEQQDLLEQKELTPEEKGKEMLKRSSQILKDALDKDVEYIDLEEEAKKQKMSIEEKKEALEQYNKKIDDITKEVEKITGKVAKENEEETKKLMDDLNKMIGGMLLDKSKALDNTEIESIMKRYKGFKGVYPRDMLYKAVPLVEPKSEGGAIINLDKAGEPGSHWCSIYWNAKNDKPSIEYFDSYGRPPPKEIIDDMKKIIQKLDSDKHMKYKENGIVNQHKDSVSCGYIAMKFLMDRMRGIPFKKATGYGIKKSEDNAEKMEKRFRYITL